MTQSTRLDLPLLLPEVQDVQDACVVRLTRLLERRPGVTRVHVLRAGGADANAGVADTAQLCLHYDPEQLSLAQVAQLAHVAGAEVSQRFAHVVIPIRAVGAEDDGSRIESELRRLPGVTATTLTCALPPMPAGPSTKAASPNPMFTRTILATPSARARQLRKAGMEGTGNSSGA